MKILHQGDGHYHLGGDCGHDHSHGHDEVHKHDEHEHHHHHHEEEKQRRNINVDAAFLHALGDMVMSIGVIIAATVVYFKPEWTIADPICTFIFSIIVCVTVQPIVKNCIKVLMEGSPDEVNTQGLIEEIKELDPEIQIHDFHLWSISVGKFALSAHITTANPMQTLKEVTMICKNKYGIDHVTLQMEDNSNENEHQFDCDQTTHQKYSV